MCISPILYSKLPSLYRLIIKLFATMKNKLEIFAMLADKSDKVASQNSALRPIVGKLKSDGLSLTLNQLWNST